MTVSASNPWFRKQVESKFWSFFSCEPFFPGLEKRLLGLPVVASLMAFAFGIIAGFFRFSHIAKPSPSVELAKNTAKAPVPLEHCGDEHFDYGVAVLRGQTIFRQVEHLRMFGILPSTTRQHVSSEVCKSEGEFEQNLDINKTTAMQHSHPDDEVRKR